MADTAALHQGMGDKVYAEFGKKIQRRNKIAYLLGMDAVEKGNVDLARQYANELDAELWRLAKQDKGLGEWEEKIQNLSSIELQGNLYSLRGDTAQAFRLLKEAVKLEKELGYNEPPPYNYPTHLSLAKAYGRAKQWQNARATYLDLLKDRPNSGFALFGLAQAWEGEGNRAEATKAYQTFLTTWNEADADLPQIKKARAWLRANSRALTADK
jgi:tetratricopeptide (TPR) repeat protein